MKAQANKINIQSLKEIAIYLSGVKDGKGSLLPLGTIVLEDLWRAIEYLQYKDTPVNECKEPDSKYPLYSPDTTYLEGYRVFTHKGETWEYMPNDFFNRVRGPEKTIGNYPNEKNFWKRID